MTSLYMRPCLRCLLRSFDAGHLDEAALSWSLALFTLDYLERTR